MTERLYTIKVVERHSDVVTVKASSAEEAKNIAMAEAECEFDCTYECQVLKVCDDVVA